MFKILALVGAIAGGATYGLYSHTDLFNNQCGGKGCPLTAAAETKPCCQDSTDLKPSCCEPSAPCCEETASCCATKAAAAKSVASCCKSQTIPVSTKAACCTDPCPLCATACEVCCPACPTVCGACCGVSVKVAIAGPAGVVAGAQKK
jgi:hypothetical protein